MQRSEAKLYRGGRTAALDTFFATLRTLGQRVSNQANRVADAVRLYRGGVLGRMYLRRNT